MACAMAGAMACVSGVRRRTDGGHMSFECERADTEAAATEVSHKPVTAGCDVMQARDRADKEAGSGVASSLVCASVELVFTGL